MSKVQVTALAVALATTAATAAGALAGGSPVVRFVGLKPVSARGANFMPHEQVRIVLRAGTIKRVRMVENSSSGAFTVSFGGVPEKDRCGVSMSLTAIGAGGDHATYRLPPRECPTVSTS